MKVGSIRESYFGMEKKTNLSLSVDGWSLIVEYFGLDDPGICNYFSLQSSIFIDFLSGLIMEMFVLSK